MQTSNLFDNQDMRAAFNDCCDVYKNQPAVSQGEEIVSYGALQQEVLQWEEWLNKHLANRPVLIRTTNTIDCLSMMLGGILSDCIPLFCDPVWKETEVLKALAINNVTYLVTEEIALSNASLLEKYKGFCLYKITDIADRHYNNNLLPTTSFCRFTSGSTGFSRCLQFTATAFRNAAYNWQQAAKYTASDKIYCLATLNNGLAFNTSILAAFFSGAELILHKGTLVPSIISKTLIKRQPTVFIAFPFIYEMIVMNDRISAATVKIRLFVSSSAPLSETVHARFKAKFSVPVCNYYGLAEVGPCTFNEGDLHTVGIHLPNVLIKTNENDQVLIKTNSMASAFLDVLGEPFSTLLNEDGYYISKDIGRINEDKQLVLSGRIGRTINIGGRKIDPVEIEQFIKLKNAVQNVLVTTKELTDRTILVAYVEGGHIKSEDVLKQCANHLSSYKIPQQVFILDAFPRSSTGKLSLGTIETRNI